MPNRRRWIGLCHFAVCAAMLYFAAGMVAQTPPAQTPQSQTKVPQKPPAVQTPPAQARKSQTKAPQKPPAQELQWKTYSYPVDGFSADFPSEPSQSKNDLDSDSGTYELRSYMAVDGEAALYVGVCDYDTKGKDQTPETLLNNAEDGALKNSSSRLVSEQAITLGIYQGLEFQAENDSTQISARLYIVGSTLYQTLVVTPRGHSYAKATRFLNSFQLIARPAN